MTGNKINEIDKKEQFTKRASNKLPIIMAIVAIAAVMIFGAMLLFNDSNEQAIVSPFGEPTAKTRSYMGKVVSMTIVEPVISTTLAGIPLEQLEKNDIVYFEVENSDGLMVPLMAYITPTGRIFTGSSMCEPCQGRYFSLAGETLVCDTCRTTYTIESHEFISGSVTCGAYPPVYMEPVIDNKMVSIPLEDIFQWKTRVY
ncbi:MAG: Fe-S-containing protein [Bacillota bacterium]|nr:DUF2318 domain-containing protein [Bacillota bacterium]MDW7729509.1 Fe-S-containing protein [Bacillota bacterium]